jgi:hypothetical protein
LDAINLSPFRRTSTIPRLKSIQKVRARTKLRGPADLFYLFKDFRRKSWGLGAFFVYQGSTQTMAITTAITIKEINTKSTGPAFMGGITAKVVFGFLGIIPIVPQDGIRHGLFHGIT